MMGVKKAKRQGEGQIMNTSNIDVRNLIHRLPLLRAFLLIALVLACFTLSPTAQAGGLSLAPDGGYTNNNTAEGTNALFSLAANGTDNTALGFDALYNTTSGTYNTATGSQALYSNTTGNYNTATGFQALDTNSTGGENTATGVYALFANTTGNDNTALGIGSLYSNTTGNFNTAVGGALGNNTIGGFNMASGFLALNGNTTGSSNTAVGFEAGANTTTGNSNIAIGSSAGYNLTTGDNNIDVGNLGVAAETNTIRIGTSSTQTATFVAGIYGATAAKGIGVIVDSSGHLGTKGSSERFKTEIRSMDKSSEAILKLKPVTFHYKEELDPDKIPQFG